MTPCKASGTSDEEGGVNIDNAPEGPASGVGPRADPVPFLIVLSISTNS